MVNSTRPRPCSLTPMPSWSSATSSIRMDLGNVRGRLRRELGAVRGQDVPGRRQSRVPRRRCGRVLRLLGREGPAHGRRGFGYYSFDLGSWHRGPELRMRSHPLRGGLTAGQLPRGRPDGHVAAVHPRLLAPSAVQLGGDTWRLGAVRSARVLGRPDGCGGRYRPERSRAQLPAVREADRSAAASEGSASSSSAPVEGLYPMLVEKDPNFEAGQASEFGAEAPPRRGRVLMGVRRHRRDLARFGRSGPCN